MRSQSERERPSSIHPLEVDTFLSQLIKGEERFWRGTWQLGVPVTETIKIIQFSSVVQSCLTLCDPMDCSMPVFTVHYQLLELAQVHVHQVGDTIQPSHPLLSLSPPAFNLSQHQGLFQWVSSSHQVARVLELQLQLQSFHPRDRFHLTAVNNLFDVLLKLVCWYFTENFCIYIHQRCWPILPFYFILFYF